MGVVRNITHDTFPKQSDFVGKHVNVVFHYDTNNVKIGKIVRDDKEHPYETIIEVEGKYIRSTECQHSLPIDEND